MIFLLLFIALFTCKPLYTSVLQSPLFSLEEKDKYKWPLLFAKELFLESIKSVTIFILLAVLIVLNTMNIEVFTIFAEVIQTVMFTFYCKFFTFLLVVNCVLMLSYE